MLGMRQGEIGRRIREARTSIRPGIMRPVDLARELGVSRQRVSSWERGLNDPQLDMVEEIAKVLGVSVDWLLGEEKHMRPNPVMSNAQAFDDPKALVGFAVTAAVRAWRGALAALDLAEECWFEPDDAPAASTLRSDRPRPSDEAAKATGLRPSIHARLNSSSSCPKALPRWCFRCESA